METAKLRGLNPPAFGAARCTRNSDTVVRKAATYAVYRMSHAEEPHHIQVVKDPQIEPDPLLYRLLPLGNRAANELGRDFRSICSDTRRQGVIPLEAVAGPIANGLLRHADLHLR